MRASSLQIITSPGGHAPRRRLSLHDQIVDDLRLRLLEGRIRPGSRIPETSLCEELDISRTPLREALKVLASEGLVRLLPHRGAVATEVTPEQCHDLFMVLAALEQLVGTLAVQNLTDPLLAEMEALHDRMLEFHERRRRADYFRLNLQIHTRLAEIASNEVLLKTYLSLTQKAMRARYLANMSDGRWDDSVEEHAAIMEALRARDGAALAQELVTHSSLTGQAVVAALRQLS
ncbi:GntR family transcriptional regulator [Allohahella marinimesophila]|uniref:GntR family transcriptional regulator n=1 Tax=Allohahella marinimesophila TaxID=1054972 RepID=A0ABP7NJ32_9GAMM